MATLGGYGLLRPPTVISDCVVIKLKKSALVGARTYV